MKAQSIKETKIGQALPYHLGNNEIGYIDRSKQSISQDGKLTKFSGGTEIYNQPYSIVIANTESENIQNDVDLTPEWYAHDVDVAGLATEQKNIPTNGKATYIGRGFFNGATATFIYNVNFNIKKGQGRLTEMGGSGKLTLQEADIKRINLKGNNIIGVEGKAESSYNHLVDGHYQLGFFGPNAEEVSGLATFSMEEKRKTAGTTKNDHNKFEFGLGGTRGEIQK